MFALKVLSKDLKYFAINSSNRAGERHFRAVHAARLHPNDFDGDLHYRDGTWYNRQPDGNFELLKSILERQRSYQIAIHYYSTRYIFDYRYQCNQSLCLRNRCSSPAV